MVVRRRAAKATAGARHDAVDVGDRLLRARAERVYGGTWTETIGRGTLLTILYFMAVLAIGLPVTAVLLSN